MTSVEHLYVKGAKLWIPHSEKVWEGATLEDNFKKGEKIMKIRTDESNSLRDIAIKNEENDLPPLRNPAILIGQNDLTSLSYLHEPAVLHNLKVRFKERQTIYTYCGIVLVAINPYADLPLYGSDIIRAYRGHSMGELEPHIFAVAEEAYAKLEREKCDLSIIVSGESGAGKTVSAKYAMRYFAAVGGSESETQIERKVLASSPIMEAIGNAKTTRNDNSSRFGKFTKLLFRNDLGVMSLTGATMQTYLLEKSRVVFQASGERNYHIFYQLCASRKKWPELLLDHQDKFKYLNGGQSPDIPNICDAQQCAETLNALQTLGFATQEISDIVKILAGILHLGNIEFILKNKDSDQETCDVSSEDLHINVMSEILHINVKELRKWLTMRQIESVNENVLIPNNKSAAEAARDALAKHIYSKLFQYIVFVINKSLISVKSQDCFIGVLDIYGFETFDVNSFEQFCINYANEKLQLQFNQHVFKLEQEEYLKEGIVWTMIDFYDNQPCIDLIESKLGILDLLDEECKMPKGSDESWARKIIDKCLKYKHFEKPRFGNTSFSVKHFSDTVEYDVHGFLEKNRDTVSKELVNVIRLSDMALCRKLMELEETDALNDSASSTSLGGRVVVSASKQQLQGDKKKRITPSRQHKQTVGSQFRDSLSLLIKTLHSTTPHYVRCIKPNEEKAPFKWEASKIVQQLRACGVLETVRISAAGFPSRWSYHDFYDRYRLLTSRREIVQSDLKSTCKNIVLKWLNDEDKFRFGHTQIFFRAGQVAYLEQVRSDIRKKYIIKVQSIVRRFIYRQGYLRLRRTALGIQRYARGMLARRKAKEIRENRAAITIQRYMKGWYNRRRYNKLRTTIEGIQKYGRGVLARRKYKTMVDNYRATEIQRYCRGYLARRLYKEKLRSVIKAQSAIRAFLARRLYKKMKAEARTISHMQKMYKGLENKIISLQQKIDELTKENVSLKMKTGEISDLRSQLESKKQLENQFKTLQSQLLEKDNELLNITKQLDNERDEKMLLLEEKGKDQEEWNNQKEIWQMENEELKRKIDEMIELSKKEETHISSHRTRLLSEIDTNEVHHAYQRALKDKETLERDNFLLQKEIERLQKMNTNGINGDYHVHSRSLSNASSQNEEDYGYASAKNTLEIRRTPPGESRAAAGETPQPKQDLLLTKGHQTAVILKLRNILEEERSKTESLLRNLERLKSRSGITATEESLRASELEVENGKLREDFENLRNSIKRGNEHQQLEAQYSALQEELDRRRDECIQLRAVLAAQSQSLKSLGSIPSIKSDCNSFQDNSALLDTIQCQKLANRQLESELKALTEENNWRLEELTKQLETLKHEKEKLQNILLAKVEDADDNSLETLKQKEHYLRYEVEKTISDYSNVQYELINVTRKAGELQRANDVLTAKLRELGVSDIIFTTADYTSMATVKKKADQTSQGMFKYSNENLEQILKRLVVDLTPKTAIGLLPGLPAYIIFMCIRYTDLINSDQHVKQLLTPFLIQVKKFYRLPHSVELRVMWFVNLLTLHSLLKQYGGLEEYVQINTMAQNQQILKNFDLSEYRQVISDNIMTLYGALIHQIQNIIKSQVVAAIIDHDETAPVRSAASNSARSMSVDHASPEHSLHAGHHKSSGTTPARPKSLINQMEQFYKEFQYFGLDATYIEQIFKQLMYYICAVCMNSLTLRGKLCMWKVGMQMRYNIGCLETWIKQKQMSEEVLAPIKPLYQVSLLFQSRKTEDDVNTIYELCSHLNTGQVLKLIKSYNTDDFETKISNRFIEELTEKLNQRQSPLNSLKFTMEEDFVYPLIIVFKYSDIKIEDIELPTILNLNGLLSKI